MDRIDDATRVAAALITTCGSNRVHFAAPSPLADATARERAPDLTQARGALQEDVALKVLDSPYREVTRPVVDYVRSLSRENPATWSASTSPSTSSATGGRTCRTTGPHSGSRHAYASFRRHRDQRALAAHLSRASRPPRCACPGLRPRRTAALAESHPDALGAAQLAGTADRRFT
ncbi:hypothetical protein SHO565_32090 [Streptomyces sp. HO565]